VIILKDKITHSYLQMIVSKTTVNRPQ